MAGTTLGTAYVQIMPSAKGVSAAISKELGGESTAAGKSAGLNIAGAIKGAIAAAGIGTVVKEALSAGADLQQSFGGLDTLYGDAADAAKNYAAEAAKAGISANDYAEQAVSFGASLKSAFGGDTTKAVEAANTAILDMADNSAKMGTDISAVQTAYAGFAKQNYTMLDNLKLGYGGTKTEMERLLKDAQAISGVEYNLDNLGDVYSAIHVIQENLGLTGVAAQEAATTFSGSLGAMKAAGQNLLANLTLGEDISAPLQTLFTTVQTFIGGNLLPMVGNMLAALPPLIGQALDMAFQSIPGLVDTAIKFINDLTSGMTSNEGALTGGLQDIGKKALEMFKAIDWSGLGTAVIGLLKAGLAQAGSAIWTFLQYAGTMALEWFRSVDWRQVGQDAITFIVNGLAAIGAFVWEKVGAIGETAKEWFKNIDWVQVGKDAVTFILNGLEFVFYTIPTKIQQIANTALSWFKNIDWWGLGTDVINGIISGINWAGGALWDTLLNLAEGAWQAVKDFFGIASPSKLMRDSIGKMIPLGIAEGIDNEASAVTDSMDAIAKDAVNSFDANIGVNSALGGLATAPQDNSTITVNVYPSAGMDEKQLADMVSRQLALAQRQKMAAWGTA